MRSRLLGGIYYCVLDVTGGRIQAPIPASDVPAKLAAEDVDAWIELHVDSQIPEGITPGQVSGMFVEVRDLDRQIVETAANVVAAQAKAAAAHAAIEAETAKKAAAFVVAREAVTAAELSKSAVEAAQADAEKRRDEANATRALTLATLAAEKAAAEKSLADAGAQVAQLNADIASKQSDHAAVVAQIDEAKKALAAVAATPVTAQRGTQVAP